MYDRPRIDTAPTTHRGERSSAMAPGLVDPNRDALTETEYLALEVRWGTFSGWTEWQQCSEVYNDGAAMRINWGRHKDGLIATWMPWEHKIRGGFEARYRPLADHAEENGGAVS